MIGTQSDSETYHRFGIAWNGKHFLCTEIGDDDKPLHLDRTKSPQEERMPQSHMCVFTDFRAAG